MRRRRRGNCKAGKHREGGEVKQRRRRRRREEGQGKRASSGSGAARCGVKRNHSFEFHET